MVRSDHYCTTKEYSCNINGNVQNVIENLHLTYNIGPRYCTQLLHGQGQHSNLYSSSNLKILHQNIRGLNNKIEELLISLCTLEPQVLCLTEHHRRIVEIDNMNLCQYTLGAKYCRQKFKQGGVSIFIHKDINYSTIDLACRSVSGLLFNDQPGI